MWPSGGIGITRRTQNPWDFILLGSNPSWATTIKTGNDLFLFLLNAYEHRKTHKRDDDW